METGSSAGEDRGVSDGQRKRTRRSTGNDVMWPRDFFAAEAMQAMIINCDSWPDPVRTAKIAYEYADALMRARGGSDEV